MQPEGRGLIWRCARCPSNPETLNARTRASINITSSVPRRPWLGGGWWRHSRAIQRRTGLDHGWRRSRGPFPHRDCAGYPRGPVGPDCAPLPPDQAPGWVDRFLYWRGPRNGPQQKRMLSESTLARLAYEGKGEGFRLYRPETLRAVWP